MDSGASVALGVQLPFPRSRGCLHPSDPSSISPPVISSSEMAGFILGEAAMVQIEKAMSGAEQTGLQYRNGTACLYLNSFLCEEI